MHTFLACNHKATDSSDLLTQRTCYLNWINNTMWKAWWGAHNLQAVNKHTSMSFACEVHLSDNLNTEKKSGSRITHIFLLQITLKRETSKSSSHNHSYNTCKLTVIIPIHDCIYDLHCGTELVLKNQTTSSKHVLHSVQNLFYWQTMIVFLLMKDLMAFTSARKSAVTGARRNLIWKYCAALSYAEWALSGIILQTHKQSWSS
jgi:hypothetical protein